MLISRSCIKKNALPSELIFLSIFKEELLSLFVIREVKHDVYGKRQTAKIELLVSDFSRLYNLGKLFAFTVIKGFFSYFSTGFI